MRPALFLALLLALLMLAAPAAALKVNRFEISLEIDRSGYAHATEHYVLGFLAGELGKFKRDAAENSSSLLAWQVDYNWFYPHFEVSPLRESRISFEEGTNMLVLDYSLKEPFAQLVRDEPRSTVWRIPDTHFREFLRQGTISIPSSTAITIKMPAGSVVSEDKLLAEAVVSDSSVMLTGITTNYINLEYAVGKPISAPLSAIGVIGETNMLLLIVLLVLVCAAVYWKRGALGTKIEGYVVEHSRLEPSEEPEEEPDIEA